MIRRGLLFALAMAGPAFGQEPNVQDGQNLFMTHCWQCHGRDATGNGPMAEMLAIVTPDLTQLAVRNGGEFPTATVATKIDGRAFVLAHGGEMPIFGPSLESDQSVFLPLSSGQPMMTGVPLANVITYLESIQTE